MNSDIRSFFSGRGNFSPKKVKKRAPWKKAPPKRTTLTDASEVPITQLKKRPKTVKTEKKSTVIDLNSDINNDPEEPMSSKQKRIIISGY